MTQPTHKEPMVTVTFNGQSIELKPEAFRALVTGWETNFNAHHSTDERVRELSSKLWEFVAKALAYA
jgi:hypothetical protein